MSSVNLSFQLNGLFSGKKNFKFQFPFKQICFPTVLEMVSIQVFTSTDVSQSYNTHIKKNSIGITIQACAKDLYKNLNRYY